MSSFCASLFMFSLTQVICKELTALYMRPVKQLEDMEKEVAVLREELTVSILLQCFQPIIESFPLLRKSRLR